MLIRLTRVQAERYGLLVCHHCGYPRNNHWNNGKKTCVRDGSCPGYKESSRVGRIIKEKKQ